MNLADNIKERYGRLMNSISWMLLTVLLLIVYRAPSEAQMQVYPVSVSTQITPPYSVNLPDYVSPGSEQLRVIILQRDLSQAPYKLFLKMEIELNGRVIIRTSPEYIPAALTLEPGIPAFISGSSLAPYFDPANMEFTGYSRDQYIRTNMLPEGAYMITFTAYDWIRREVALSRGGSFFCYLAKSEPPLLNLPMNNAMVSFTSPQYINFQWLSRTTSSPNSASSTRYSFELFEMRVGGISPSEIVTNTRPFFTAETDRTTLMYSISEPALEKGMRYVWRVRAFDTWGRDYIRNNGYSEAFSFVYGEGDSGIAEFNPIGNFNVQALTPRKAKLTWDISASYGSYRIYYRKQGNGNRWYESETIQNSAEINGLSPGVTYECKVQGRFGNAWGGFSITDTVSMPPLPVIECGSPFTPLVVTNREPLQELMRLQEFDAGGFMVTVADPYALTIKPGRFSGKGYVQVPLFGHKKIRCEFNDIFINTDYQMVEGNVRLLCDQTDGKDNALWDLDEVFEGGAENGSVIEGKEEVSVFIPDVVIADAASLALDTVHGQILVMNRFQDTLRINVESKLEENPAKLTVQDSEGNLYSVDTQTGKATSLGKALPAGSAQQLATLPAIVDTRIGKVIFEPVPGQTKYAFDKRSTQYSRSNLFNEEYKTMKTDDGELYDIPYKLIPVGETDVVLAKADLKGKSIHPDSIIFRSGSGSVYKAQATGKKGEYLLTLPAGKANDGIEVIATYTDVKGKTFVLGKMIVLSYSFLRPQLTLVPVNGTGVDTDVQAIREALDKVYLPVAVEWQVSLDASNFEAQAGSLDIKGSGLFSQYTEGMKTLNNAFILQKGGSFDPSAVYLFLLRVSGEESATGDMPRGRQFGYVFTQTAGSAEAINRTIAHEIAHGAFSLSHTFDSKYQITEKTTNNLLDYTAGTDLVKHQWDAIHDPGLVIGMFERDEDGMNKIPVTKFIDYTDLGIEFTDFSSDIAGKLTFLTPSGYPIVLPKEFKFCFSGITTKTELDNVVPLGVLTAFKDINNNAYVSAYFKENGIWKFKGYIRKGISPEEYYQFPENELKSLPDPYKLILGIENEQDCKVDIGFITLNLDHNETDFKQPKAISAFNYLDYQTTITASYDILSCRLPSKISSLTKVTIVDLFVSETWVKYNHYGDNGVLFKYNLEGMDYYVYSNIDAQGKSYYYTFDEEIGKWRNYVPQRIEGILNSLSFLLNPKVLGKAAKDGGHQSLDVMGMIPLLGEGFDALNGLWYLFENEKGQAVLCFASTIPITGWVTTGGKWVWKGARKYARSIASANGVLELVELSDEAIGVITKKINDLNFPEELTRNLAADLKSNPELIQKFGEKPELIESWRVIKSSTDSKLTEKATDLLELNLVLKYLDDIKTAGGYENWKVFDEIFSSARKRAIEKYGKDAEFLIYTKFENDGGAVAVIIDHYGNAGLDALKKIDNLPSVASELIKGKTMYRYVDENAQYLNSMKISGEIPSGYTTYVTLDKFEDPIDACSKMQLPPENNAVWRIEFHGDQLINNIKFPYGKFNNTEYIEVLSKSFPEWGEGGATQFITISGIKMQKMTNIKSGEIIKFE